MDLGLRGARVLVTAASRGLGAATARRFSLEGARVVISDAQQQDREGRQSHASDADDLECLVDQLVSIEQYPPILFERVAVAGEIHDARVIGQDRPGRGADDRYSRRARARRSFGYRRRFDRGNRHLLSQRRIQERDHGRRPQRDAGQKGLVCQQHRGRTAPASLLVH